MENLFMALGTVLVGFGAYIKYEKSLSHASKISPKTAKNMIKLGAKVIDVRSVAEYKLGHHPKAVNIVAQDLSVKNLKANKINENDVLVVYCNTGTRARRASDKLVSLGYPNVYYIVETHLSIL